TRIENLIHKIQYKQVTEDLQKWYKDGGHNLLEGLLIVNRYQYPTIDTQKLREQINEMHQLVLENKTDEVDPNDFVALINDVLYFKLGFSGNTSNYHDPQNSYLSQVLETRKGNPLLLACIYLLIAERMGLPIYGINLPKHFILGYEAQPGQLLVIHEDILFYINAFIGGRVITQADVLSYLKQLSLPIDEQYMMPCTNLDIIIRLLHNLQSAYEKLGQEQKAMDITRLINILK